MNGRQLARNEGRIPALLFHIERCKAKKQWDRVKGFEAELERRKLEMKAAGHDTKLQELLKKNPAKA